MLSSRVLRLAARRALSTSACLQGHGSVAIPEFTLPQYYDHRHIPLPDIPYMKVLTPELKALKEKEKGAWASLSAQDKVQLYRIMFNQTYADMKRGSSEWKTAIGGTLFFVGVTALVYMWQKKYGICNERSLPVHREDNRTCRGALPAAPDRATRFLGNGQTLSSLKRQLCCHESGPYRSRSDLAGGNVFAVEQFFVEGCLRGRANSS
ncbi:hypothetical protein GDO78_022224 [Eleutherodactylus coqui]|uniref:Cytochrome c oxidase subunit 4 n=1 Tax=Eleutherodactylus coqui TaxID=57060 RepID=A0A8J6E506_ELECQ|nr:hypothetical protein GDO78_022224 [Eleutherodactylus coqui]